MFVKSASLQPIGRRIQVTANLVRLNRSLETRGRKHTDESTRNSLKRIQSFWWCIPSSVSESSSALSLTSSGACIVHMLKSFLKQGLTQHRIAEWTQLPSVRGADARYICAVVYYKPWKKRDIGSEDSNLNKGNSAGEKSGMAEWDTITS